MLVPLFFYFWLAEEGSNGTVCRWKRGRKGCEGRCQTNRSSPTTHYTLQSKRPDRKQVCVLIIKESLAITFPVSTTIISQTHQPESQQWIDQKHDIFVQHLWPLISESLECGICFCFFQGFNFCINAFCLMLQIMCIFYINTF